MSNVTYSTDEYSVNKDMKGNIEFLYSQHKALIQVWGAVFALVFPAIFTLFIHLGVLGFPSDFVQWVQSYENSRKVWIAWILTLFMFSAFILPALLSMVRYLKIYRFGLNYKFDAASQIVLKNKASIVEFRDISAVEIKRRGGGDCPYLYSMNLLLKNGKKIDIVYGDKYRENLRSISDDLSNILNVEVKYIV